MSAEYTHHNITVENSTCVQCAELVLNERPFPVPVPDSESPTPEGNEASISIDDPATCPNCRALHLQHHPELA